MTPLIVLVAVTITARAMGMLGVDYVGTWPAATAAGLAAMFVITGTSHFTPRRRAGLIAIVPPSMPRPEVLVTVTGVLELCGAAVLLIPVQLGPYRVVTAWGLAALLAVVFPANVYAAGAKRATASPNTPLLSRTAMQCVFLSATLLVAVAS